MRKTPVLGLAFVLLLAAFPLISAGTTGERDALWWAGLALLAAGALIPPVTRFAMPDDDDGDDDGEAEEEDGR
jgi:hypothetical protein